MGNDPSNQGSSLPPGYFEDVYRANADPWDFATSPYEAAKYDATLASLPRDRYVNAFEIGCSIGVLTERLAPRCERLLAVDVVPDVLAQARQRCARFPHVRFAEMPVPAGFPDERFDLIVLSEVGYYWSSTDLHAAKTRIENALTSGGHLVLVHWTPFVHDYPLTGDQVHEAFLSQEARSPLTHLHGCREERYRLDVLERRSGNGQASRTS